MSNSNFKRLRDYIRLVDVRNQDLKVKKLLGLSVEKRFFPSIANTIGTDMSTYKIIKSGQFVYIADTSRRGDKIAIALYDKNELAIVSQAYSVFEITDEEQLCPDYLMMWFRRPEFDRYARYKSHGSAREIFDWETMCDVMVPIPPIEEQRKTVAEYQALVKRIEINNQLIAKLEDTAQAIYRNMFVDGIDKENLPEGWKMGTLGELGKIITGKTPSSNNPEDFGNKVPFVTPGDFTNYTKFAINAERKLSEVGAKRLVEKILPIGSVIVTCIGSDMGKVAISTELCITNQQMNSIVLHSNEFSDYLYYNLISISKELKSIALGSSTMPMINKSDFERIQIVIPPTNLIFHFSELLKSPNRMFVNKSIENKKLYELQSLLLAKMGQ